MSGEPIYLDFNATTPVLPEVLDAMLPYLREQFGNPSSDHPVGQRARAAVAHARAEVAQLIGARPDEIIFTGCATESNNLALFGAAASAASPGRVVTTSIEHPAVSEPIAALERRGWSVERVAPEPCGVIPLDELRAAIGRGATLVSIMHANNEIGTLQPVREAADAARAASALVHSDAAQSVGKVPVQVDDLGVDLLTIAGHKLYAPKGVGALYVRRGTKLEPVQRGAGHEHGLRPGTENVASIVGLGRACSLAGARLAEEQARVRGLRDRLWSLLKEAISDLSIHGADAARLPNTLSVRFPGATGAAVLAASPGVLASTGSACHAGEERASSVVLALGVPATEALGTVRLSLGVTTRTADVDRAARALIAGYRDLRSRQPD